MERCDHIGLFVASTTHTRERVLALCERMMAQRTHNWGFAHTVQMIHNLRLMMEKVNQYLCERWGERDHNRWHVEDVDVGAAYGARVKAYPGTPQTFGPENALRRPISCSHNILQPT
jgi:hypothetical protein